MELYKTIYNNNNLKYFQLKRDITILFLSLFSLMCLATIFYGIVMFVRASGDILSFILVILIFAASILYIIFTAYNLVDTNRYITRIKIVGEFEYTFKTPYKLEINKKFSTMQIVMIVCSSIILLCAIVSTILLILDFKFEYIANILLFFLISLYSIYITLLMLIESKNNKLSLSNHLSNQSLKEDE